MLVDNLGKNMVLATWERNSAGNLIWYPMFYDCDSMLGLNNEGYVKFDAGVDFQDNEYNTSNSRLWTKLRHEETYGTAVKQRYHELRDRKILDADHLLNYYESVINEIGEKFYNWDARLKYATLSDIPMDADGNKIDSESVNVRSAYLSMCNGNRLEWTRKWLQERIIYMDSVYQYGDFMKSNIVLRSQSHTGQTTIRLKTYTPQRVTVRFSDANTLDSVVTMRCSRHNDDLLAYDGWYEFTGNILNANDNNITIVGGHNVMDIGGLEDIDLASVKLGSAPRLASLKIPGARSLQELEVSNNYMLQEVDLSGCKKLGALTNYRSIDLTSAKYLKKLNVSNTQLRNVTVAEGGTLEDFNISNSFITAIVLKKQPYLETLDLTSCSYLSDVQIEECNSIKNISIPGSSVSRFQLKSLRALTFVDISRTTQLDGNKLSIQNCDALKEVRMQHITSQNINTIDFSTCLNIETIDITGSPLINYIKLLKDGNNKYNKIKRLYLRSSGIIGIQYGADPVDGLDLSPFTLTALSLDSCRNVTKIKGINLTTSSSATFQGCGNLQTVEGTIKLTGGAASSLFAWCSSLKSFPTPGTGPGKLDLTEVTSAASMFYGAQVTWPQAQSVLKQLTKCTNFDTMFYSSRGFTVSASEVLTDAWRKVLYPLVAARSINHMFNGCNIAQFEMPEDFFSKNLELTSMGHNPFASAIRGVVPKNLLKPLTKLTYCPRLFGSCSGITEIPEDIFFYNTQLNNIDGCFAGCHNMNIRRNDGSLGFSREGSRLLLRQTKVTTVDNLFADCFNLNGEIPGTLFESCGNLTTAHSCFSRCRSLTGTIPNDLFNYPTKLTNVSRFFYECTGLSGSIKAELWNRNSAITTAESLFAGCTGLGGDELNDQEIAENFFTGKVRLLNISHIFSRCSNLRFKLVGSWFNDFRALNEITGMFSGCSSLYGSIPGNLFVARNNEGEPMELNITGASSVFSNCTSLTGSIPNDLFKYFKNVQSLDNFFSGCWRLSGRIPARENVYEYRDIWDEELGQWIVEQILVESRMGLLDNCTNLIKCNGLFSGCTGIGKSSMEVTDDDPYAIPENLFSYCNRLVEARGVFNIWLASYDGNRVVNKLHGEIPPKLFSGLIYLSDVASFFHSQSGLTGPISSRLFGSQGSGLKDVNHMFAGCGGLEQLQQIFTPSKHTGIKNVSSMFDGCSNLYGTAKPIISALDYVTNHEHTFRGCTKLSDYDAVHMLNWK